MNQLFKTKRLLIFLGVLLCFACHKDKSPDVDCKNGGTWFNGDCVCTEGFTGPDCSEVILTPLKLTQVKVTHFPALRRSGEPWDGGNNFNKPDITIALEYHGLPLYTFPEDYSEADYTQSYTFNIAYGLAVLYHPDESYKMALYDRDNYTDDLMGELSFVPLEFISTESTFPLVVTVQDGERLAFELTFEE